MPAFHDLNEQRLRGRPRSPERTMFTALKSILPAIQS